MVRKKSKSNCFGNSCSSLLSENQCSLDYNPKQCPPFCSWLFKKYYLRFLSSRKSCSNSQWLFFPPWFYRSQLRNKVYYYKTLSQKHFDLKMLLEKLRRKLNKKCWSQSRHLVNTFYNCSVYVIQLTKVSAHLIKWLVNCLTLGIVCCLIVHAK